MKLRHSTSAAPRPDGPPPGRHPGQWPSAYPSVPCCSNTPSQWAASSCALPHHHHHHSTNAHPPLPFHYTVVSRDDGILSQWFPASPCYQGGGCAGGGDGKDNPASTLKCHPAAFRRHMRSISHLGKPFHRDARPAQVTVATWPGEDCIA